MAKKLYIGVNGVAQEAKEIYVGVDGVAKKVVKGYIGDSNNTRKMFWEYVEPEPEETTIITIYDKSNGGSFPNSPEGTSITNLTYSVLTASNTSEINIDDKVSLAGTNKIFVLRNNKYTGSVTKIILDTQTKVDNYNQNISIGHIDFKLNDALIYYPVQSKTGGAQIGIFIPINRIYNPKRVIVDFVNAGTYASNCGSSIGVASLNLENNGFNYNPSALLGSNGYPLHNDLNSYGAYLNGYTEIPSDFNYIDYIYIWSYQEGEMIGKIKVIGGAQTLAKSIKLNCSKVVQYQDYTLSSENSNYEKLPIADPTRFISSIIDLYINYNKSTELYNPNYYNALSDFQNTITAINKLEQYKSTIINNTLTKISNLGGTVSTEIKIQTEGEGQIKVTIGYTKHTNLIIYPNSQTSTSFGNDSWTSWYMSKHTNSGSSSYNDVYTINYNSDAINKTTSGPYNNPFMDYAAGVQARKTYSGGPLPKVSVYSTSIGINL